MAPAVKQRTRVRQDYDGYPSRFGRIAVMFYHWREETHQHEYTVLVRAIAERKKLLRKQEAA